jgi:hypothetical protein
MLDDTDPLLHLDPAEPPAPRRCASFLGSGEPTLDQLFAAPIVRQLMQRDGIDEGATRRLLQQMAAARPPVARLCCVKSAMGS